jgi:membrane protease YdiL (CAAX protease family)
MSNFPSQFEATPEPELRPDGRVPDPGSPFAAKVAWIFTIILMGVVVGFNQLGGKEEKKSATAQAAEVEPPDAADPFPMTAKFFVKFAQGWNLDASMRGEVVKSLGPSAKTPADKVRLAIVVADLQGAQAGLDQLKEVGELSGALKEDAQTLRKAYEAGGTVDDGADRQRLIEHHGWFGKLAGTYGLKNDDPARAPLLEGAARLIAVAGFAVGVLGLAFFGGIAACVTMAVMMGSGKVRGRFVPPAPGGSVFIETVPVFIAAFLLLHLVLGFVAKKYSVNGEPPEWLMPLQLSAQWALIVIPLWPVLARGMKWSEFRWGLGWHAGRGVLREMGAGVVGYFAGLPLLAVVIAITVGIFIVRTAVYQVGHPGENPPTPANPVADLISKGSPGVLAMLFVLATCWAPIVEEAIFRGAMYRQLRTRLGVLAAAGISALAFGCMHGYSFLLLGPVICLGFVFALMREWRGSLIASMTAHFMHNATALAFVFLVLSAIKD